jgi:hypothetical protein
MSLTRRGPVRGAMRATCTWQLRRHAEGLPPTESVTVAPFDTELFGHWWFEGVDFITDLYRRLGEYGGPSPRTASATSRASTECGGGARRGLLGANGDFSLWLNPGTLWTWERLWPLEERFWSLAPAALKGRPAAGVLAQAAAGAAPASGQRLAIHHLDRCGRRLRHQALPGPCGMAVRAAGRPGARRAAEAEDRRRAGRDDAGGGRRLPDVLPVLATVLEQSKAVRASR